MKMLIDIPMKLNGTRSSNATQITNSKEDEKRRETKNGKEGGHKFTPSNQSTHLPTLVAIIKTHPPLADMRVYISL